MDTRCKAKNRAGEPCSAAHYRDGWCRWHHPDLEVERQAARAAGGRARSNSARARRRVLQQARDLHEVDALLGQALHDVLAGEIEPGVASAAASIARAICTVRDHGEVSDRIAELERRAGITVLNGGRRA